MKYFSNYIYIYMVHYIFRNVLAQQQAMRGVRPKNIKTLKHPHAS